MQDIFETIIEGFQTLTLNKMRTGLAILGIIIGIGSVITLISLGQGSQKSIEDQIQSLGSNLLTVSPARQSSGGIMGAQGGSTSLTLSDAKKIEEKLSATLISKISPEYSSRSQVISGRNNTNVSIIGVYPQYADIKKITMSKGVFITERDNTSISKVAVLGPTTATDLFGEIDPIGKTIKAGNQTLKVIGVTVSKGGSGFNNPDDMIYVPLTTAQKQIFGKTNLTSISIEAKSKEIMVQAQDEIGYLLLSEHKLTSPEDADFTIMSQSDLLSTVSQVTGTLTALLGGIAAISLLVGGIGIMNIMLVTVTERTREIGLRKALGAKKKTIITQFLIESILLTFIGGIFGMIFGLTASFVISKIMNLSYVISVSSIALAIGVSSIIGIVFGLYPAKKAANLQPIEALRYE
ncbi:MAG: ABC transporter permease [Candidatus Roizmanbacteria bacterium]|nr:ABC transporter permease [Candidatus Roizmanbacteria bacterium]MCR4313169.1 ABC transporter permease [Candidatus Roizmanbacteria bacterium]